MGVPSLNDRALRVAEELVRRADELGVAVRQVAEARVIDAGVEQRGSISAGLLVAQACLADLGTVTAVPGRIAPGGATGGLPASAAGAEGNTAGQARHGTPEDRGVADSAPATHPSVPLPFIAVSVNHPVAACMASQYAGWQIHQGDFFAMGSGPIRAAYGKEKLFDDIGFREKPKMGVGILETAALPTEVAIRYLSEKTGISPQGLTLIAARTASLVGGTQVVARSVETTLHKLHELGFDLHRVVGGYGAAPLPPVAKSDMKAIGRTNDAILYGGEVTLMVTGDDDSLRAVGEQLPSSASKDHGRPFIEVFEHYDHDFYKIDPMLFSPALVSLQNLDTGKTFTFGKLDHEVLMRSFFG